MIECQRSQSWQFLSELRTQDLTVVSHLLFFQTITKWFSMQDRVIHALEMYVAQFLESVKIHSSAARVLLRFVKISQHRACIDHAILY